MSGFGGGGFAGGGGMRMGRRSADEDVARKQNAAAPEIEHLWRRVGALFRPYLTQIILTIAIVVVSAGIGVIPPLLVQRAFDEGLFPTDGGGPNMDALWWISIGIASLLIVSSALGVWQTQLTSIVGARVTGRLRTMMFEHLQKMELAFFTRTKTGVIQSRLQNDVGGVANTLRSTVTSIVGNIVTVSAALVAMLLLSWQLTLVAVALIPLLVFVQRRVGQVRARIATKTQESLSEMTAITQEALSVSGVLLAKSFGRQSAENKRYSDATDQQNALQVSLAMSGQWFFALVSVLFSLVPVAVYLVAGYLAVGGVTLTAGTIVAFTTVQARLTMPLIALMRIALDIQTSKALFARIFEYLDLKPAITETEHPKPLDESKLGEVEFDDVTFRYSDAGPEQPPTLDHVSFHIEKGAFVAFVGPSGAGKTTISYLVPRLYETTSGAVKFAGTDVRDLASADITSHVGIVSQETYLFHSTIADNLRYAKPDATQEELERACRAASIHNTIASFPDGYQTVVGERGYRLSGGEKQRIAIARVLLKDPPVLVLDEATSALDSVAEKAVQEALDVAAHGRTTIAIAHRLSTIVNADRIFVVQAGHIAEQGTHQELLDREGVYATLFQQQRI